MSHMVLGPVCFCWWSLGTCTSCDVLSLWLALLSPMVTVPRAPVSSLLPSWLPSSHPTLREQGALCFASPFSPRAGGRSCPLHGHHPCAPLEAVSPRGTPWQEGNGADLLHEPGTASSPGSSTPPQAR